MFNFIRRYLIRRKIDLIVTEMLGLRVIIMTPGTDMTQSRQAQGDYVALTYELADLLRQAEAAGASHIQMCHWMGVTQSQLYKLRNPR